MNSSEKQTHPTGEQKKLRAAFNQIADVLEQAPEALAGLRLNNLTHIVEAFDPNRNDWVACSNNITNSNAMTAKK
jgi:hypothetical protein